MESSNERCLLGKTFLAVALGLNGMVSVWMGFVALDIASQRLHLLSVTA